MNAWRPLWLGGVFSLFLISNGHTQKPPEISLKTVKYDGLKDAVNKSRGKVVLVDLWGEF
ncbi:MAG: hypothetical protein L0215_15590 [Gemmataceae bacterium]|nr:hypothetical protein [Gemmataceae bacterium]